MRGLLSLAATLSSGVGSRRSQHRRHIATHSPRHGNIVFEALNNLGTCPGKIAGCPEQVLKGALSNLNGAPSHFCRVPWAMLKGARSHLAWSPSNIEGCVELFRRCLGNAAGCLEQLSGCPSDLEGGQGSCFEGCSEQFARCPNPVGRVPCAI